MIYLLHFLLLVNQTPAGQSVSGGPLIDWVREIRQVDENGEVRTGRILQAIEKFGQRIQDTEESVGPVVRLLRWLERWGLMITVCFVCYMLLSVLSFAKSVFDLVSPWFKKSSEAKDL